MDTLERVIALRTGGATERAHGVLHRGSYNVAAHTWGVLALLYVLWPEDYARLAAVVTFHDVPEAWVGDIPAPTKRYSHQVKVACDYLESAILERLDLPNVESLPKEDKVKVEACDRLELYLWAREEQAGGNVHARCVMRELDRFFAETPLPLTAHNLLFEIRSGSVEHKTDGWIKELMGVGKTDARFERP
jgi:5'-deoxynucleotidase YfbR-like HD superfamily hydrolase